MSQSKALDVTVTAVCGRLDLQLSCADTNGET